MKRAFVFPGQGSQKLGMCKELAENFSVAKHVFQEVDDVLGQHLSKIIFEGPEEQLNLTENTQPALMACSIALLRVLEQESSKKIDEMCSYVAGHSLGEFTALTAINAIEVGACAKLLKIRGRAMQDAVPVGVGAMFALLGANIDAAHEIAKEASAAGVCDVANDNSPQQQVLSGTAEAINEAIKIAFSKGYKAIKLNVSAPFHSSLMKPAQEKLREALEEITLKEPCVPLIANVTAEIIKLEDVKKSLVIQAAGLVKWCDSIKKLKQLGIHEIIEVGPGKVYSNLTKKIDPDIDSMSLNDITSINDFITQKLIK